MSSAFVICGNGSPHALLTEPRRAALLSWLNGAHLEDVDELAAEGLVRDGRPTFLVAGGREVALVQPVAQRLGRELAQRVERAWPSLPAHGSIEATAFLLVGDLLLDQALLDALTGDDTLMPPAPERRSGCYYAWLAEGGREAVGHYGQRVTALADSRLLLSFGRYERLDRDALHDTARTDGLPTIREHDLQALQSLLRPLALTLVDAFRDEREQLERLHQDLRGQPSFGEFVCWIDHLAYSCAIDLLGERGLIAIPNAGWTATVISP